LKEFQPTEPFPYQEEDVRRIEDFEGRALVAGEMGTGKTLETLLYCFDHPSKRPIIVVCPKSLKWNWAKEAKQHIGMDSIVLEGGKPPTRKPNYKKQLFIINYDVLPKWVDFLKSLNPQIVIGDEIHYIKNGKSKRCKAFKKLCKDVPHVLAISGTPMVNKPSELWNAISIIKPSLFDSKTNYLDEYCDPQMTRWGMQYNGATNLSKLHKILISNLMIRRLKRDVLKDLPPKSRFVTPLSIDKPNEYKAAQQDFIKWLSKQSKAKAKKARSAESLVKMGYLKRLAAQLKLSSVFDWVDTFLNDSEGKLILFCIHKNVLSEIYNRYKNTAVFIDGSVTGDDRRKAVETFQKSKYCRIFIGNIAAAGVGITLTAATTVAFAELDWVPGNMTQCEDRAHRIGQNDKVQIFYLVAHGTIEEKLCEILQKKQGVLDAALDGQPVDESTLNVYDELERELSRTFKPGLKSPGRPSNSI